MKSFSRVLVLVITAFSFTTRLTQLAIAAPELVKDIFPQPYIETTPAIPIGNNLLFLYRHPSYGVELFKLNRVTGKLSLVKDVVHGTRDPQFLNGNNYSVSKIAQLGANRVVYFYNNGTAGAEPWISDGTAAGTRLLADLNPSGSSIDFGSQLISTGNRVFFTATTPAEGNELYVVESDSQDVNGQFSNPGTGSSFPNNFATAASIAFFTLSTPSSGEEPYYMGPTDTSPQLIADIVPGAGSSSPKNFTLGNHIYFTADDGSHGVELFKSDGAPGNTALVKDIMAGSGTSNPGCFVSLSDGTLNFIASSVDFNHREIWHTDGTNVGTVKLVDLGATDPNAAPQFSCDNVNGKMIFQFNDGVSGTELWVSDGTVNGTQRLTDAASGLNPGMNFLLGKVGTSKYLFSATNLSKGAELWVTDGTPSGTKFLKDLFSGAGSSYPQKIAAVSNGIYFIADTKSGRKTRTAIFFTNGTASGTKRVALLPDGGITYGAPYDAVERAGSNLFFVGNDNLHSFELWKTNGTPKGTKLVKDINPGDFFSVPQGFSTYKNSLMFTAFTAAKGGELYSSDGTSAGTKLVKDVNPGVDSSLITGYGTVNNKFIFSAYTPALGLEMYATNGTTAGTNLIQDLNLGSDNGLNFTFTGADSAVLGTSMIFAATNGTTGNAVYKTDGASITLVKDSGVSQPKYFTTFNNKVYFSAVDGSSDRELWVTDGSTGGTTRVADMNTSASFDPKNITAAGTKLYFTGNGDTYGNELYTLDGSGQPVLTRDIVSGTDGSTPGNLVAFGNKVLFTAEPADTGSELWISDGTSAGTHLVKDIVPGATGSAPQNLIVSGKYAYFSLLETGTTAQIWRTDGTSSSTKKIATLSSGVSWASFGVRKLEVMGKYLVVMGRFGDKGREIYRMKL